MSDVNNGANSAASSAAENKTDAGQNPSEIDKEKHAEYREELTKVQEDIATLRMVLNDKLKREQELKTLLGVTFADEIKKDFFTGINVIKSNNAVQKTTSSLKSATESLGDTVKHSLGSLKNSNMFKSFDSMGFSSKKADESTGNNP